MADVVLTVKMDDVLKYPDSVRSCVDRFYGLVEPIETEYIKRRLKSLEPLIHKIAEAIGEL